MSTPNPIELLAAQAVSLRAQAEAIVRGCEALILTCDAIAIRPSGAEGAPAVPFLMGGPAPVRPAGDIATPPAIPTRDGADPGVPRLLTFDDPPPRPVAPTVAPTADAAGDLQPPP